MTFYEVVVKRKDGSVYNSYCTTSETRAKMVAGGYVPPYSASVIERNDEIYWSITEYARNSEFKSSKMFIGKFQSRAEASTVWRTYYDNIPSDKQCYYGIELHTLKGEVIYD